MILTTSLKAQSFLIDSLQNELEIFCNNNTITLDMFVIELNILQKQLYIRIESNNKESIVLVNAYVESFQTRK